MSNDKNTSSSNQNISNVLKHSKDVPVANFKPPAPPANQSGQSTTAKGSKK